MRFEIINSINPNQDIILPCRKGELNSYKELLSYADLEKINFKGELGEVHTLYNSTQKCYLVGTGEEGESNQIATAFRKLGHNYYEYFSDRIQVYAHILDQEAIQQVAQGLTLASYKIGTYKNKSSEQPVWPSDMTIGIVTDQTNSDKYVTEGYESGLTINRIKELVDAPANIKSPEFLAEWATHSAAAYGYKCTIKDEKELQEENFGAIIAVGQASVHPPRLITLQHIPRPQDPIDIGIVGKGITFDSGGLSIKESSNLHYMKSDMGGAAVVLGVMELAAKLSLDINIVGIVAAAENAVDGNAFRPSDVIQSYSGKSIEIIDTDAEGRLVLADAIYYMAQEFKPKKLIDLATLTGSTVRTLGYSAAALFTPNDELAQQLSQLGDRIHERVWRLPLYKDFEEDLHSDIADIRNFSGKPIAGAITAAKFIEAFTDDHEAWAHLDIAGVAFGSSEYAKMKSASGYGVRLILEYIKTLN